MQFGTAVLIGILLVKGGMPTGMVSVYEALMFLASLFCFFWVVGGQNALLQLYPKLDEQAKGQAIAQSFVLFSIAGLLSGGLLYLVRTAVAQELTQFEELPHLPLLALFVALNSPSFLLQIIYLLLKDYRSIVIYGAVSFSLQLLVVVLPIWLGGSLQHAMIGLVGWACFKYAWTALLVARHGRWKGEAVFLRRYLPLVLPLLLFALVGKGTEYVSGLVVGALFEDDSSFAVFRYGARESPLAVLMMGALATSLTLEMAENTQQGLQRIKSATRRLSHWLYPVSMAGMLAAPFVFPLVFSPDFKDSARIFNIFTLLLASRILLPQVVTMGHGKNYVLTLCAVAELLVLTVLSFWWGRLFGLEGVAYAAVASFMVDRAILLYYNWKVLHVPPKEYVDWKSYALYNSLLVLCFLVSLQY